jgi:hypothetical protein
MTCQTSSDCSLQRAVRGASNRKKSPWARIYPGRTGPTPAVLAALNNVVLAFVAGLAGTCMPSFRCLAPSGCFFACGYSLTFKLPVCPSEKVDNRARIWHNKKELSRYKALKGKSTHIASHQREKVSG